MIACGLSHLIRAGWRLYRHPVLRLRMGRRTLCCSCPSLHVLGLWLGQAVARSGDVRPLRRSWTTVHWHCRRLPVSPVRRHVLPGFHLHRVAGQDHIPESLPLGCAGQPADDLPPPSPVPVTRLLAQVGQAMGHHTSKGTLAAARTTGRGVHLRWHSQAERRLALGSAAAWHLATGPHQPRAGRPP